MRKFLATMVACLLLSCAPAYDVIPAYAAEEAADMDTEPDSDLAQAAEDIKEELALVASYVESLEAQHMELMDVLNILRTSNALLLILVAMELMRLVRGWTKGGRQKDGPSN